ncbi:MAG: glycosyltransferase [Candidatus Goldiibacteriota bacterium]
MKNKKIAIIIQHLSKGGAETSAARLSKELKKSGFEPVIILFKNIIDYNYAGRIITLEKNSGNFFLKKFSFFFRLYKLRLIKKRERFSVSISFLENANLINILSRRNEKVIISTRNDIKWLLNEISLLKKIILKTLYKRADKYVLLTKEMKKDAIKFFGINPQKTAVLYNPIDTILLRQLSKESAGPYEKIFQNPVLINSGRLSYQKGQWHLIRIFRELKKEIPSLKLIIAGYGDGHLKDYLVNLSINCALKTYTAWGGSTLNSSYDVYFTGFIKNPYSLIARSKLFLFPSISEGLGNALIEAMACGVPVIASDCPTGPSDILTPKKIPGIRIQKPLYLKYGALIPPFNGSVKGSSSSVTLEESMWINAIKNILNNNKNRNLAAKNCMLRASDFNPEKIMPAWLKIISE